MFGAPVAFERPLGEGPLVDLRSRIGLQDLERERVEGQASREAHRLADRVGALPRVAQKEAPVYEETAPVRQTNGPGALLDGAPLVHGPQQERRARLEAEADHSHARSSGQREEFVVHSVHPRLDEQLQIESAAHELAEDGHRPGAADDEVVVVDIQGAHAHGVQRLYFFENRIRRMKHDACAGGVVAEMAGVGTTAPPSRCCRCGALENSW